MEPILLTLAALAIGAGTDTKVEVCHLPPGNPGNYHTLTIPIAALPAHLAHGDLAGPCGSFCGIFCNTNNKCAQDTGTFDPKTERCICSSIPVDCSPPSACFTALACDPTLGCEYAVNGGAVCNADNNACTGPDTCDASGTCRPGPAVSGCCLSNADCPNDLCQQSSCVANRCTPSVPTDLAVACAPANACEATTCDGTQGCVRADVTCEAGQTCVGGTCVCTDTSCAGCCAANSCHPGTEVNYCGGGGGACATCGSGQSCLAGQCVAPPCSASAVSAQVFDSVMAGCAGHVPFADRASLCDAGSHVCSATDWLAHFGGVAPTHNYYTSDLLGYGTANDGSVCASASGPVFCTAPLGPFGICVSGGTDAEGNVCFGYDHNLCPNGANNGNTYFGGCNAHDTSGALCCW